MSIYLHIHIYMYMYMCVYRERERERKREREREREIERERENCLGGAASVVLPLWCCLAKDRWNSNPKSRIPDDVLCQSFVGRWVWTNQKNSGWTSVDRSTKATLSTYNTWIQLSRLQKIYHFQSLKLRLATKPLTVRAARMQQGRDLMLVM